MAYEVFQARPRLVEVNIGPGTARGRRRTVAAVCRRRKHARRRGRIDPAGGLAPARTSRWRSTSPRRTSTLADLRAGEERLASADMIDRLVCWQQQYPIVSIEDGLAEEDWESWPRTCESA